MIIILRLLNLCFSFLLYFSFQVHFCSIFLHLCPFLPFFFPCASNESIRSFICMLSFLLLFLLAFCKSSEKNDKTIRTIGKFHVPLPSPLLILWVHSRPQSPSFLGHMVGKREPLVGYKLSQVALWTRMLWVLSWTIYSISLRHPILII